jgi:transcriptional regulator with XRE-family HTH domain
MNHALAAPSRTIGEHIRDWRRRRRMSQLHFAIEAEISQKHLSFIESGRSSPSREMVLRLAEHLHVPLRERNAMVLAAGYAPAYPERRLDDPALAPAREAVDLILKGHEPYPALAVDRHWTLVASNSAVARLMALVSDASLLQPPVNVLRLALDPGGLAPHIVNFAQWRTHLLERLREQVSVSGDATLAALHASLRDLPHDTAPPPRDGAVAFGGVAVPLRLRTPAGVMSFISTTTVFGTPIDVTLSEIALETFFPADARTGDMLRGGM